MKQEGLQLIPKKLGRYNTSLLAGAFIVAMSALTAVSFAAIAPTANRAYSGQTAGDLDQWQRITVRPLRGAVVREAEIRVAIQTRGPSMQGLIRIPGAPASNFDTGKGLTVVELINVGSDAAGYAEIASLEILFTQKMPGQFYQVFAVDSLGGNGLEKQ